MKCKCAVVWQDRRKKGSGDPVKVAKFLMASPDHTHEGNRASWEKSYRKAMQDNPNAVVCDGDFSENDAYHEEEIIPEHHWNGEPFYDDPE